MGLIKHIKSKYSLNLVFFTNPKNMSSQKHNLQLISAGQLIPSLHYGPFAGEWWLVNNQKTFVPIRINMRIQVELNKTKLVIRVVNNDDKPGYVCESDETGEIYLSPSEAINETYKKLFDNRTRYSGLSVMGFDNDIIISELLSDVIFSPFKITLDKLTILVINLGDSSNNFDNIVGSGYQSSFNYRYQGKQCLFVQKKISTNNYEIEIFQKAEKIITYNDISPTEIWKKIGILKNHNGDTLFGINHPTTIEAFEKYQDPPICNVTQWNDIEIMTEAFDQCLKKKIAIVGIDWYKFFVSWKEQKATIIELISHLKKIYPSEHVFTDRELNAWRRMMKKTGCVEITPYKRNESKVSWHFSKIMLSKILLKKLFLVRGILDMCNR